MHNSVSNSSASSVAPVVEPSIRRLRHPLFGSSLPLDSPETLFVLQSLFTLSHATKPLFPAAVGYRFQSSLAPDLLKDAGEYVFGVFPRESRRCMVLCLNWNVYVVDSKLFVWNATKHFPPHFASEISNFSLIDADMMTLEDGEENKVTVLLNVCDCVALGGPSCRPLILEQRLDAFQKMFQKFLSPMPEWYPKGDGPFAERATETPVSNEHNNHNHLNVVRIGVCRYYSLSRLNEVLSVVQAQKQWNGVVRFVPSKDHYKLGLNKRVFVWRPLHCIGVDFQLRKHAPQDDSDNRTYYQLLKRDDSGKEVLHDWLCDPDGSLTRTMKLEDECVCECIWNPEARTFIPAQKDKKTPSEYKGGWEVLRVRDDKALANTVWIVSKLIEEIDQHPTQEELMVAFGQAPASSVTKQRSHVMVRRVSTDQTSSQRNHNKNNTKSSSSSSGKAKKNSNYKKTGNSNNNNNNNNKNKNSSAVVTASSSAHKKTNKQ